MAAAIQPLRTHVTRFLTPEKPCKPFRHRPAAGPSPLGRGLYKQIDTLPAEEAEALRELFSQGCPVAFCYSPSMDNRLVTIEGMTDRGTWEKDTFEGGHPFNVSLLISRRFLRWMSPETCVKLTTYCTDFFDAVDAVNGSVIVQHESYQLLCRIQEGCVSVSPFKEDSTTDTVSGYHEGAPVSARTMDAFILGNIPEAWMIYGLQSVEEARENSAPYRLDCYELFHLPGEPVNKYHLLYHSRTGEDRHFPFTVTPRGVFIGDTFASSLKRFLETERIDLVLSVDQLDSLLTKARTRLEAGEATVTLEAPSIWGGVGVLELSLQDGRLRGAQTVRRTVSPDRTVSVFSPSPSPPLAEFMI